MKHRYKVREIAQQAGLSEATVDRVLHERPGVREDTRAEVQQAISDLDKQRSQLRLNGRKFLFDVVMQTPPRFAAEFRAAIEAEMPMLSPALVRSRFHFRDTESVTDMVETLGRLTARGTHGVILKAPDHQDVADAIDRLVDVGVPVVTYVTDVPASARQAYVGIDNRAAGATAAYLVDQWLGDVDADVMITLSSNVFRGEEEREIGFRSTLRTLAAERGAVARTVVEINSTGGLDATIGSLVADALDKNPNIEAVYSIGGGNTAIARAFDDAGRSRRVFVGHDLDEDNRVLLRTGTLSAVLHHDLRADARLACRTIMQARGALEGVVNESSPTHVVTRFNSP